MVRRAGRWSVAREDGEQRDDDRSDVAEEEDAIEHASDDAPLLGRPRRRVLVLQSRHVRLQQLPDLTNIALDVRP